MEARKLHEPETFECPFCRGHYSVIYREHLPGGVPICCECRIEQFHVAVIEGKWEGFDERARKVWALRCQKWAVKDVARKLGVSVMTVKRDTRAYAEWLVRKKEILLRVGAVLALSARDRRRRRAAGSRVSGAVGDQAFQRGNEVLVS